MTSTEQSTKSNHKRERLGAHESPEVAAIIVLMHLRGQSEVVISLQLLPDAPGIHELQMSSFN